MAAQSRPPPSNASPSPSLQRQPLPTAAGFDAVYNWFNNLSSNLNGAGFENLFNNGGNQGGLGNIFSGAGGTSSTSTSRLNTMPPLAMVCKAPQLRPAAREEHSTTAASSSSIGLPSHESVEAGATSSSSSRRNFKVTAYEVDKEDLYDQHVGYYLRHHQQIHALHTISRKRPGVYDIDGREIKVEWQYATEPGGQGFLVALDGPLRQPFSDYMEMTEANAEYDSQGIGSKSALHSIPKEKRMSFHDQHKIYNRLEAMKVAKEQALVRERAADYVKDGREIPGDLMTKYKKTIQQKLEAGSRARASAAQQRSQALPAAGSPASGVYGQGSASPTRPPPPQYPGAPAAGSPAHPGASLPDDSPGDAAARSPGDFVIPTPDQPDNPSLNLDGLVPAAAPPPPVGFSSGDVTRFSAGQAGSVGGPERQFSGPLYANPGQRARQRARTESPQNRQHQWPSLAPPAVAQDHPASLYASPAVSDARAGSYVPPPVARDACGGSTMQSAVHDAMPPRTYASYSPPGGQDFQGGGPLNWSTAGAGTSPASDNAVGGSSPHKMLASAVA